MTTEAPSHPAAGHPPEAVIKPKGDGFLMKIIIVGVLLLVVMAGEFAIVIYYFGGSGKDDVQPDPHTKLADAADAAHGGHDAHAAEKAHKPDTSHSDHGASSAHGSASHGSSSHGSSSHGGHGAETEHNYSAGDIVEVEIERFNCANGIAAQGFTTHVTFRLIATVTGSDRSSFLEAVTVEQKFRVHQAVDKVIRSSTHDELNDANLDRIKRRIREDINKVLGNSFIQDVIITEFRMMEQ